MAQMASETPPDLGKAVAGINNQQMAKQVKERIQKARVKWLQGHWEAWRMEQNCTVAAVQTLIRAQPLCLWECKAFTSEAALRMHLNTHDDCIIPKHIAKDYELTRVSLVEL